MTFVSIILEVWHDYRLIIITGNTGYDRRRFPAGMELQAWWLFRKRRLTYLPDIRNKGGTYIIRMIVERDQHIVLIHEITYMHRRMYSFRRVYLYLNSTIFLHRLFWNENSPYIAINLEVVVMRISTTDPISLHKAPDLHITLRC